MGPVGAHFLRIHYSTDCGQMILNFYEVDTESREKIRPILVKIHNIFRNTPMLTGKKARPLSLAEPPKAVSYAPELVRAQSGRAVLARKALQNRRTLPAGDHRSPLQTTIGRFPVWIPKNQTEAQRSGFGLERRGKGAGAGFPYRGTGAQRTLTRR